MTRVDPEALYEAAGLARQIVEDHPQLPRLPEPMPEPTTPIQRAMVKFVETADAAMRRAHEADVQAAQRQYEALNQGYQQTINQLKTSTTSGQRHQQDENETRT